MKSAPLANNELESLKSENKKLKEIFFKYDVYYPYFSTKFLGNRIGNKTFSLPKELYTSMKLWKINIYHDIHYVTKIEMFYKDNSGKCKSFQFGEGNGTKKSLEFQNNENIENLIINAGDLIDGITIETNKNSLFGRIENVGGTGYLFNIKEISKIFEKKVELIGFEGNYNRYIIQTKAIFKFL